jgi:YHS domain-containing protein
MNKWVRQFVGLISVVAMMGALSLAPASAKDAVYTSLLSSQAVSGYDPVAYFRVGKPVEGLSDHSFDWNGATWRFANAQNLADFKQAPEKYAPQYGGYCAWAVSQGYTASSDPQAWHIRDGKLYLNYSKSVQATWAEDIPGHITKANANWPKVIQ